VLLRFFGDIPHITRIYPAYNPPISRIYKEAGYLRDTHGKGMGQPRHQVLLGPKPRGVAVINEIFTYFYRVLICLNNMIQRIQSLYLLLAAGAAVGTWFLDIYKVTLSDDQVPKYFNAQSNFMVFVVYMLIVALSLFCIFLFKNRKLQFRLIVLDIFLAIAAIALQYFKVQDFVNAFQQAGKSIASSTYLPGAFLPVLILIFLIMAARGVYKDEKLIKSLDRLR